MNAQSEPDTIGALRTEVAAAETRAAALHAKLIAVEALLVTHDPFVFPADIRNILDRDDSAATLDQQWKVWIPGSSLVEVCDTEEHAFEIASDNKFWLSTWAREVAVRSLYMPGPWKQITNLTPPSAGTQLYDAVSATEATSDQTATATSPADKVGNLLATYKTVEADWAVLNEESSGGTVYPIDFEGHENSLTGLLHELIDALREERA
jgi:hypothetical protein